MTPDILIRRGVPGMPQLVQEVGDNHYPTTAPDIAKLARTRGLSVEFEDPERADRQYIIHKAADVWLPILDVSKDLLVGISGGLFSWLILQLLGAEKAETSTLHVDYRVHDNDGSTKELRLSGQGSEVLEALDRFETDSHGSGPENPSKRPAINEPCLDDFGGQRPH